MAYSKTNWRERQRQYDNRYRLIPVYGQDGYYDLQRIEGAVQDAGTAISPTNLNHIEDGIGNVDSRLTTLENQFPPNNVTGFTAVRAINGTVQLFWKDPDDTIIGDNAIVKWSGTKIVRKIGSAPSNENDGDVVVDSKTRNAYQTSPYVQIGLTNGTTYYYRAFPYSVSGIINRNLAAISVTPVAQNPASFTSSGFFVVPQGVSAIDLFMVGGGASGRAVYPTGQSGIYGAGGGSGYTKTYKASAVNTDTGGYKDGNAISVTAGELWTVIVGSGGDVGAWAGTVSDGGNTSFTKGSTSYVASGGKGSTSSGVGGNGGSGGSGAGPSGGQVIGGTNGSNGNANGGTVGTGQGHTTREWGDAAGTLYASGGGITVAVQNTPNEAANTGNGGSGNNTSGYLAGNGGSGILKVRW